MCVYVCDTIYLYLLKYLRHDITFSRVISFLLKINRIIFTPARTKPVQIEIHVSLLTFN